MLFKQLILYRHYIFYCVKGNFISEVIDNHLGVLWLILEPLFKMLVYFLVFAIILKKRTIDFTSFLLVGVLAWSWFSSVLLKGSKSIYAAGSLMKQIYVPKVVFPLIVIFNKSLQFLLVFCILLIYFLIKDGMTQFWISLPYIIVVQFLLVSGVSLIAAAILPVVPDLKFILVSSLSAMLFCSGVFYEVPPSNSSYEFFMLNPMAKILEQYRVVLIYKDWPEFKSLALIGALGFLLILVGNFIIKRFEYFYPRIAK